VTEQINALKELSDIVAKSGRAVDVSEPRPARASPQPAEPQRRLAEPEQRRPAPPQAEQRTVVLQAERPAPVERSAQTERPTQERPAAAERAGSTDRPVQPERRPVESRAAEPASPRPTLDLEPVAPSPKREAAAAAPQSGWVRDLLRGASQEEVKPAPQPAQRQTPNQRTPQHVVESLNSLSVDIARAIDHDAAIELWDRYRRGERDVFTRRLYTLKGQQTFDEIRRKYQAEAEFRAAVDRYCDDFEKLLKDVTRTDRDPSLAQTYLSSDTGKVYTMLAHASGRLK
jgi:hypothetical protein